MKKKELRASDFEINLAICQTIREIADEHPDSKQSIKLMRLLDQVQTVYLVGCPPIKMTFKKTCFT